MRKRKTYLRLALVLSILFGIILPLALGVKDLYSIALIFTLIWFVYAITLFVVTYLIRPGLKIKASRQNGVSVVKYEL